MDRTWRALLGATMVSLVVSACGGDTGATTTSIAPSTTSTTTTTTATSPPTNSTSAPTTATTVGTEEVGSLLVVGDWGSGTLPQGAVAGAMMRYAEDNDIAAILTTGDNFYSDDAEFLMEPYSWSEEMNIPWWVTWGNHDLDSEQRIEAVNQVFDDPLRWAAHRWGDVDVVILDSTQVDSDEQDEFLEEELSESTSPTIVVFHHPRYTCGTYSDTDTVDGWVSQFDDDVVLVLSGHEHSYQRFDVDDVIYTVTGGGGAALTDLIACPEGHPDRDAAESVHHFLALTQGDEGLTVTATDVNGNTIDEFAVALP